MKRDPRPTEELRQDLRAAISNAYYEARNERRTMEEAADVALEAVLKIVESVDLNAHLRGMSERGIQPGDLVEHIYQDLDPREVVTVGRDFLTLDILGKESSRLPKDNYRTVRAAEGSM